MNKLFTKIILAVAVGVLLVAMGGANANAVPVDAIFNFQNLNPANNGIVIIGNTAGTPPATLFDTTNTISLNVEGSTTNSIQVPVNDITSGQFGMGINGDQFLAGADSSFAELLDFTSFSVPGPITGFKAYATGDQSFIELSIPAFRMNSHI